MSLLRVSRRLLRPLGRPDGKKSQTETKNTAGKVVKTDNFFTQFLRSGYTVKQLTTWQNSLFTRHWWCWLKLGWQHADIKSSVLFAQDLPRNSPSILCRRKSQCGNFFINTVKCKLCFCFGDAASVLKGIVITHKTGKPLPQRAKIQPRLSRCSGRMYLQTYYWNVNRSNLKFQKWTTQEQLGS